MADDLCDIPEFLVDAPRRLAARVKAGDWPAGPSIAASGRPAPRVVPELAPLSSSAGQKAREVARLVRLEPRPRAELADVLGWHPGAFAAALKLAEAHGLIRLEDGVYRRAEP